MKPAPFSYHAPRSPEEVDDLLAELGSDAKVLAGGQSLVPLLNMRLVAPTHLVDINRVEAAAEPVADSEAVEIGALVRQAAAEHSRPVAQALPVLRQALRFVAHPAIRSRGTVTGSIAHADPAAELPALFVALGGSAVVRRRGGRRTIHSDEFFAGPFETTLHEGEWVESVRLPYRRGRGYAVDEVARRHGDYALCGVIAVATPNSGDAIDLALTYFGVGDVPVRVELSGAARGELQSSVREAVADVLDPPDDLHANRELRTRLAERLGARAGVRALDAVVG